MSMNYNKVMLAGNLTRDPQVRFFANERAVADFGLAINRRYKGNDGQMKEETTFVDVECWGRTAELVGQYLTKGSPAFIEGRLKLDSWEDKKDGQKRSKLKVLADTVQFMSSRQPRGGDGGVDADGESAGDSTSPVPSRAADGRPARPAASAAAPAGDDEPPF
jgi:single-strand DNA-binding protein